MYSFFKFKALSKFAVTKNFSIVKLSFMNFNFFIKTFYNSSYLFSYLLKNFFFFNLKKDLLKLPIIRGSFCSNNFNLISSWFNSFLKFNIIGFELWGLGLNVFLLNKRTKLGKKYKEKKKKKKN